MKGDYQKASRKLTEFFFKPIFFQTLLMNRIIKNKRAWNEWPVVLQVTKQVQKNSFTSYVLSYQVWWCNIKWFLSYSKSYISKFMPPIHDIRNCSACIWAYRKNGPTDPLPREYPGPYEDPRPVLSFLLNTVFG